MKKQLLKTILLATLPLVAVHADNNVTLIDPFANDPAFQHFQKLQERMDRVFEEFNQEFFSDMKIDPHFKSHFSNHLTFNQRDDFKDMGDSYELKIDIPDMNKDEIKVNTKGNLISIQAKHENKNEEKRDNKIVKQEHFVGMMSRTLTLPNDADPEKYTTNYKDGILTVTIEKRK